VAGILENVRVLDFGRYIAAPFCCQLLADMGAEVVRVERPGGEVDRERGPFAANGQSLYFVTLNRNKKAITLNLNSDRGRELLLDLVKNSDVLVHNQPMGRARSLGLDYERLAGVNPRLVYLAISGFGSVGPNARDTAFDAIVQSLSGAAAMTGFPGGPPVLSHVPFVDFGTGLYGALAVSLALLHRERTGRGQSIDLALFSTGFSFVAAYGVFAEAAINGVVRERTANTMIYGVGGLYACTDGQISICSFSDPLWQRLCGAIDRIDLASDPRLRSDVARYENRKVVDGAISAWCVQRSVEQARAKLAAAGVPAGRVQAVDEAAQHPQAHALGLIQSVEQPGLGSVPVAGSAIKFSETPGIIQRPAPSVGEHNTEIYDRILGEGSARRLREDNLI
jgi:crotonobetainyl-CoA:carnitine CoA-transferase CaiB-like acyl-CoA transferase